MKRRIESAQEDDDNMISKSVATNCRWDVVQRYYVRSDCLIWRTTMPMILLDIWNIIGWILLHKKNPAKSALAMNRLGILAV